MRGWILAGLLSAICVPVWADAPSAPSPVISRAEQCLRDHVDRVVAADHDLTSAANFLVGFACAKEVADAAHLERNRVLVSQFNAMVKGMGSAAPAAKPAGPAMGPPTPGWSSYALSVDPDTGNVVFPKQLQSESENPGIWGAMILRQVGDAHLDDDLNPVPPDLRALAGELVLAAHERLATAH